MPNGYALEDATSVDVVAAYAAPPTEVPTFSGGAQWIVVGEFFLPSTVTARIDAIALVSDPTLTCKLRLVTSAGPISGATASTTATIPTQVFSGVVTLAGATNYQIQAQTTGASSGADLFSLVLTATISD